LKLLLRMKRAVHTVFSIRSQAMPTRSKSLSTQHTFSHYQCLSNAPSRFAKTNLFPFLSTNKLHIETSLIFGQRNLPFCMRCSLLPLHSPTFPSCTTFHSIYTLLTLNQHGRLCIDGVGRRGHRRRSVDKCQTKRLCATVSRCQAARKIDNENTGYNRWIGYLFVCALTPLSPLFFCVPSCSLCVTHSVSSRRRQR
jgi:hypothetical protein